MRWTLLLACALLSAPLTGCATDDGEEPSSFAVTWEEQPTSARTGETIAMSWTVDGPDGQIPHTGVHYAGVPVEDPQTPADYGNTSGAVEPAQIPDTFDTELTLDEPGTYHVRAHAIVGEDDHRWSEEVQIEITQPEASGEIEVQLTESPDDGTTNDTFGFTWQLDGPETSVERTELRWGPNATANPGPDAYEHTAGTVEDATVPGTYEATLSDLEPGTYHARALAVDEDEHRWSEEVRFEVTEAENRTQRQTYTVTIEGFDYDPGELTVRPGDRITWENADAATHTVTFDEEALQDSGDVASGETYTLTVPEDVAEGTYDYSCDYHASMQASVTVEAAD